MASKRVDEIIETILQEPNFLDEDGKSPPWSSKIWKSIANKLNTNEQNIISPQYLYTMVRENRYNILSRVRLKFGLEEIALKKEQNISINSNSTCSSDDGEDQLNILQSSLYKKRSLQAKQFKIVIPFDVFQNIKPMEKKIRTKKGPRINLRLQKGWSDVFFDAFWDQYKLPCSYAISYHKVSGNYITFRGQCTECNVPIFGDIDDFLLSQDHITINILAIDTTGIKHVKKRYLRHPKRFTVGKDIINSCASQWQRNMADKQCNMVIWNLPIFIQVQYCVKQNKKLRILNFEYLKLQNQYLVLFH